MLNRVMIIGNCCDQPTVRHTQQGTAVASFTVATNKRWKDKQGEQQEETEFHRVVAWAGVGEFCGNYLNKGSKVYCEGELKTRKWQDQQGNDKYTTEIIARTVQNLTPRTATQDGQEPQESFGDTGGDLPF